MFSIIFYFFQHNDGHRKEMTFLSQAELDRSDIVLKMKTKIQSTPNTK